MGRGGRCKIHGGGSTGPKTAEGMARSVAGLVAAWEARREERSAQISLMWRDPAYRLKVGITLNETLRKRDVARMRAREPGCDWHWLAARERKRRARIENLRAQAETAALNDQIRAELFGKRSK